MLELNKEYNVISKGTAQKFPILGRYKLVKINNSNEYIDFNYEFIDKNGNILTTFPFYVHSDYIFKIVDNFPKLMNLLYNKSYK